MAWTEFLKGTTVSADEINNNFDLIGSGNLLPRTGSEMTSTSSVFNIGSDNYRFNYAYFNNMNIEDNLRGGFLNLVSEVILSASTSEIEFTGLNGDNDNIYYILSKFIFQSATVFNVGVQINNDADTNNYGYCYLYASSASYVGGRLESSSGLYIGRNDGGAKTCFSEFTMYSKSGSERVSLSRAITGYASSTVELFIFSPSIWNNTSDTITSIKIYNSAGKNFDAGTIISLFCVR